MALGRKILMNLLYNVTRFTLMPHTKFPLIIKIGEENVSNMFSTKFDISFKTKTF